MHSTNSEHTAHCSAVAKEGALMQLQAVMLQAALNSMCARDELQLHNTARSHRVHLTARGAHTGLANAHIGTDVQCPLPAHQPAWFSL